MGKRSRLPELRDPEPTLLAWRNAADMSRQDVVNKVAQLHPEIDPLDQATVAKWETGESAIRVVDLRLLAEVYGTSADRLLFNPTDNVTREIVEQAHEILSSKDPDAIRAWLASGMFLPASRQNIPE